MSIRFSLLSDLIREADYWARKEKSDTVSGRHVDQAIEARKYRSNMVEEKIQEMIKRGQSADRYRRARWSARSTVWRWSTWAIICSDFPSRITATTAMGREGVINIEREAELCRSHP